MNNNFLVSTFIIIFFWPSEIFPHNNSPGFLRYCNIFFFFSLSQCFNVWPLRCFDHFNVQTTGADFPVRSCAKVNGKKMDATLRSVSYPLNTKLTCAWYVFYCNWKCCFYEKNIKISIPFSRNWTYNYLGLRPIHFCHQENLYRLLLDYALYASVWEGLLILVSNSVIWKNVGSIS